MIPYELHLALRYLRFHRGRTFLSLITLISVAGVTVGTAALVVALSLMNGFVEDFRNRILTGSAHLQAMRALDAPSGATFDGIAGVEADPGVEAVAPVLFTHSMIVSQGDRQSYGEIYGIDPVSHSRVLAADAPTRGALALLSASGASGRDPIVLGEKLSESLGAFVGDTVRVVVPKVTLSPFAPIPRSRVFEVVAVYSSDYFEQDATRAYIGLGAAQALLAAPGSLSHLEIRVRDLARLDEVKTRLRGVLGPPWVVVDLIEFNQVFIKALNEERMYLFLAIWLIVVVASLNIVSTLVLMVMDKIKDIGTLTAMGARPGGIAATFLLQGAVIGLAGTAMGLALGAFLAWFLDRYEVLALDPNVYYLSHVRFLVRPMDLLKAGAMAMGTSLLATIYPALKAATLDPVEAIRYE